MRRALAAAWVLTTACAAEEAPTHAVSPVSPPQSEPEHREEAGVAARTVPSRYETHHIGGDPSTRARWAGHPIDLDVKDADIHNVFRLLADAGHANIVVSDDVIGRVTVTLKQVPWDQALDVVARSKALTVERDGNVILITRHALP